MIKVNDIIVDTQKTFPDGTLAIKAPVLGSYLFLPFSGVEQPILLEWYYENDSELFALICLRKHFADREAILRLPYIPNARQDRVKNPEDVFTLKYFCEIINSLNFKQVRVLDAHSNVSLALLDRVFQIDVAPFINCALGEHKKQEGEVALFFPDEGAVKRYGDDFSNYPIAFGMKKRDWATGKILGLEIMQNENIVGKNVLIIDDICSKGGTFYYSAKALKEAGAANISLYITHCENTILQGEIFTSGLIDKVYTTNSLVHCDELKEKIIYV
jgi:ribose-phosphate pyrophosphokinase